MATRLMKRYSTLLIMRKMQTKATVRYSLTPVRVAIIKKCIQIANAGEGVEKSELPLLLNCRRERELVQPVWKTAWQFLKKLKLELPYDPAIPFRDIHPDKVHKGTWGTSLVVQWLRSCLREHRFDPWSGN